MRHIPGLLLILGTTLSGCVMTTGPKAAVETAVSPQMQLLSDVNAARTKVGATPLQTSAALQTAAGAHAKDMAGQNRAWHFGTDGSSPLDRARAAGFAGALVGEAISESTTDVTTVMNGWMKTRDTRDILMDGAARQIGVGHYRDKRGRSWWVVLTGR